MPKRKLFKYAKLLEFKNVLQPVDKLVTEDFFLKGLWHKNYFGNNNPIILELGCGKGEYTLALSEMYPQNNFIGIDNKGDRLYNAGKIAIEKNLTNAAFIRTQIQFIEKFFAANEINEIWITFPDPQLQKPNHRKRLTSSEFLNRYRNIVKPNSIVHLKTDNIPLFDYTLDVLNELKQEIEFVTRDLYAETNIDALLSVKTHYEKLFSSRGAKINYLRFRLNLA